MKTNLCTGTLKQVAHRRMARRVAVAGATLALVFTSLASGDMTSAVEPQQTLPPTGSDALTTSVSEPPGQNRDLAGSLDPEGFWTEEKLRDATPLDLLPETANLVPSSEASAGSGIRPNDGVALSEPVGPLGSNGITPLADPVASTVGRLFFNTPDGPRACLLMRCSR